MAAFKIRTTVVVLLVLVAIILAGQDVEARKRSPRSGKSRPCRKQKNKHWCNKENVEEMIKDHPAVNSENLEKGEKGAEQQSCPAGTIGLGDNDVQDVNERSLAPWVYVTNHSANRIPETFVEAKCLCEGCLIYGPDGVSVENSKDFVSVPIQTPLTVLERYDCDKRKRCKERQRTEEVTVGCVCATRKRVTVPIG